MFMARQPMHENVLATKGGITCHLFYVKLSQIFMTFNMIKGCNKNDNFTFMCVSTYCNDYETVYTLRLLMIIKFPRRGQCTITMVALLCLCARTVAINMSGPK